ncbi:unnamed protein product [Closterium sp. NIES-54]
METAFVDQAVVNDKRGPTSTTTTSPSSSPSPSPSAAAPALKTDSRVSFSGSNVSDNTHTRAASCAASRGDVSSTLKHCSVRMPMMSAHTFSWT